MGAFLSTKNETLQMNFYLYESYKSYLSVDQSLLKIKPLPTNFPELGGSLTFCCLNFHPLSLDWKKHFSQRIKINQEHFFWAKQLQCFSKQLPNIMKSDDVYLTKLSKKLFCCLGKNYNNFVDSFSSNGSECKIFKNNCLLIELNNSLDSFTKKRNRCKSNATKQSKIKQMIWDSFRSSKNDLISIDKEEAHKNKIGHYQLFKLLTEEIEDHLNDKKNGLSLIKNEFNDYFVNFFDCQEKLPQTKQAAENLIIGIKFFVRVFTECLMILYKIEDLSEYLNNIYKSEHNLFRFDNFLLFATNLIFTQRIYEIILYLQRKFYDFKEEQIFSENLAKIKDENIEFFEIPPQFTLNQMTLNKLQRFPEKEIPNAPYNNLINMLKKIESMSSPIFHLKLLCQISEGIEKEIKIFYENCQKSFIDELDTDIFLAIHIYIIAKSGIKHLISILNLIERIISEKLKMELPGYYLTLFKAAALYIKEISI